MSLQQLIEQHWQKPKWWLTFLLSPLSWLFARLVDKRRHRYLSGCLKQNRLPVPVVVVGNVHVGGTGKTPITLALVQSLQAKGIKVGVISRGYGRQDKAIHVLNADSTVQQVGDEPLLYRYTSVPMAVGANRYETGLALLQHFPEIELIVADDGLQHYALARDLEICVFPARDIQKKLMMLPNGNLREPLARLQSVDAVVFSQADEGTSQLVEQYMLLPKQISCFYSETQSAMPYRLNNPQERLHASDIQAGQRCVAAAAIANPQRFFDGLQELGFVLSATYSFADHGQIDFAVCEHADYIFITEKDAVKLPENKLSNIWVLPICAIIQPDLGGWVIQQCSLMNKESD